LLQPRSAQALPLPTSHAALPVYWPTPVVALAEFIRTL
jgi:hypothetical protein